MKKYIIAGILVLTVAFGAIAAGNNSNNEWKNQEKRMAKIVNVQTFCKTQTVSITEQGMCVVWITNFRKKMAKYFRGLTSEQLKRIHKRIARRIKGLANRNSKHNRSLRDAVKGIGDTIRKPIEVPTGVRRRNMEQRQQQYIK